MDPLYHPKSSHWLDLRVFYARLSNCEVDESTPKHLTLNYIPLTPDTIIDINGRKNCIFSDYISSTIRRDSVDRRSDEATFVSTDSISVTGNVKFEVYDRGDLLLSGVLELCNRSGYVEEPKINRKKWSMKCQSTAYGERILKGKRQSSSDFALVTVEVGIAGCFSGSPIILTKTLQMVLWKKQQMDVLLDSIPEHYLGEQCKELLSDDDHQVPDPGLLKQEHDKHDDYESIYRREEYVGEDNELSWFNAGVRVGVGLGLGISLGLGVGVGLLVRTYQATTRNFARRLI